MNPNINETNRAVTLKVIGVGGGGGNAVTHLAGKGLPNVSFVAVNTDAQALARTTVADKLVLGAKRTRGLGAGGDPEVGRAAAEADRENIKALCQGADIIFVAAGLGGGTGTGAAPVVAQVAKETGALVLALVTLPFEFEGGRRQRQAAAGLQEIKSAADAVICLSNQKVLKLIDENTSMVEAFAISNELLGEGVCGIWRMLTRTGLINVDFNDLCAVTRGRHSQSSFATVEATGESRGIQVGEKLLAHPLLDGGQTLQEADTVLISIVGGEDLSMNEVNKVMEKINRQCESAHLMFGATIDPAFNGKISVTLVASSPGTPASGEEMPPTRGQNSPPVNLETQFLSPQLNSRPASRFVAPAPELPEEKKAEMLGRQGGRGRKKLNGHRQTQLPLEIVSKGRFEKSEPTIHQGEDLDVPTYIRRGVALN